VTPGFDVLADHFENLGSETPGYAHLLDIFGRLDCDCHANLLVRPQAKAITESCDDKPKRPCPAGEGRSGS